MSRLIDADDLIIEILTHDLIGDDKRIDKIILDAPTVKAIPIELYEQMKGERDVAIEQLKALNIELFEKPYLKAIPIEWLLSIMRKQIIFAMESEMEGNITVQDGVIHCVSGALACQVLANVIKLWEKENEESSNSD